LGKREAVKKERLPRDYYGTIDPDAVVPLLPFIEGKIYVEPCAGSGQLIKLVGDGTSFCSAAYDIDPQEDFVVQKNCLFLTENNVEGVDCFVTNPPFSRTMLEPIIEHLSSLRPTWLLLPADMMHNKYMSKYLAYCSYILSVGRLYWFLDDAGKKVKGVDNYAWYCFDQEAMFIHTKFIGRV
jgi:hypothetical protein